MPTERPEMSKEMKKEELKVEIKALEKREQSLLYALSRFDEDMASAEDQFEKVESQKDLESVRAKKEELQAQLEKMK